VERCITDLELMRRWLNPVLVCEPIGDWKTDIGGRSRFLIQFRNSADAKKYGD